MRDPVTFHFTVLEGREHARGRARTAQVDGEPDSVLVFSFGDDGRVHRFHSVLAPEKLRHLR